MKKLFTTLIVLLAVAFNLQAQNVFISPETGHLIAAVTYDNETGFENGFSALWRHNQLGLSVVVSDEGTLTDGSEIANPAGNLNIVNGKLTLTGGQPSDCYMVVSLPKGYRFTYYSITLDNDMNGHAYSRSFSTGNVNKWFYETDSKFQLTDGGKYPHTAQMSGTNDASGSAGYTISRNVADDKTDRLYFRLHKPDNANSQYYGVSIRNFEIHFAANLPFNQPMQALPTTEGVSVMKSSFMVGKPELGTIKPNTKNGKTYYSYNYRNVDDLEADNLLYQESAVKDGRADASQGGTKTITRTINGGEPWFALMKGSSDADNTYYVETPVELTREGSTDKDNSFPTGYRIIGATLNFALGQQSNAGHTIGINNHGDIVYLQSNATVRSGSPETRWVLGSDRRLRLGNTNTYVYYNRSSDGYYYLSTRRGNRTYFYVDNNNLIYTTSVNGNRMYIHESSTSDQLAVLSSSTDHAAEYKDFNGFTPASNGFTATVYDKNGTDVAKTATISSSNQTQEIKLEGFNNDAIKFAISGLKEGEQALVSITLQMEHLNPYIHSMTVRGTDRRVNQYRDQTFTADNFNVRGGHFVFQVPADYAGDTFDFSFVNLRSNYTDDTYPVETGEGIQHYGDGNARVFFVNSAYAPAADANGNNVYKPLTKDNSQPDYTPVTNKLEVTHVGTVPFHFNNADELSNESDAQFESQLEERTFTPDGYLEDTGYKDANNKVIKGSYAQLSLSAANNVREKVAYIAVGDEPRYNIAPTTATEHRYYAHYIMDIEIKETNYVTNVKPQKIYKSSFYVENQEGNEVYRENSMWGIKVTTTDPNNNNQEVTNGHVNLGDVMALISKYCSDQDSTCIADKLNADEYLTDPSQILYVDMSEVGTFDIPTVPGHETDGNAFFLGRFRDMMSPNCLFYMPNNSADAVNNYVHKSSDKSDQFQANANIILKDKQPFFALYPIAVTNGYAKYTREITHSSVGKSKLQTLVLPFEFDVNSDGVHKNIQETRDGTEIQGAGDGKSFQVFKLSSTPISSDKGKPVGSFDNSLVDYDQYVQFTTFEGPTAKAYTPYIVYANDQLSTENETFSVFKYHATITRTDRNDATDDETVKTEGWGKLKIEDAEDAVTGSLENKTFTMTPTVSMAGCKLGKNEEKCLYFSRDRFRTSWSLTAAYDYAYVQPFRCWFATDQILSAKSNEFGIAFNSDNTTTGITNIEADKAEQTGTYKFIYKGQLYIHTDNGVFTVDGRKVNL